MAVAFLEILKALPFRSGPLKKISLATLDQALVSATNFAIGLTIIRLTHPEEYGYFVFANAALLFIIGMQSALISTPMTVILPSREETRNGKFPLKIMIGQSLLLGSMTVLFVSALQFLEGPFQHDGQILAVTCIVSNAVAVKELIRTWFYITLKPAAVLMIDLLYALLLFLSLALFVRMGDLDATKALWGIGAASLAVVMIGFLIGMRNGSLGPIGDFRRFNPLFAELFRLGRWGLLGSVVTWFQTQSYAYLVIGFLGPKETALASASRLFFAPLALMISSWGVVYMPWGAKLAREDPGRMIKTMNAMMALLLVASMSYSAILLLFYRPLIDSVLGAGYQEVERAFLVLWSAYFCIQAVRGGISNSLLILQEFRGLCLCSIAAAVVTVSASWPLIVFYGIEGSILGLVLGEVFLIVLCSRFLGSVLRKQPMTGRVRVGEVPA